VILLDFDTQISNLKKLKLSFYRLPFSNPSPNPVLLNLSSVTFLNKIRFLRHPNFIFESLAVTIFKIFNSPRHPNFFLRHPGVTRHSGWEALR
jgi:hypothetical protein